MLKHVNITAKPTLAKEEPKTLLGTTWEAGGTIAAVTPETAIEAARYTFQEYAIITKLTALSVIPMVRRTLTFPVLSNIHP